MAVKKLFALSLLLIACQKEELPREELRDDAELPVASTPCLNSAGEQWDPEPSTAILMEPTEETEEGRWYENEDWNLKFLVPMGYEDFNVFQGENGYMIYTETRPECLPFGDAGAWMVGLYKPFYYAENELSSDQKHVFTNFDELLGKSGYTGASYATISPFSSNFYDFQKVSLKGLGGSTEEANYFIHDGAVFALGTAVCGENAFQCENGELMQDMLRHLQPLQSWSGTMNRYVHEMGQSYLSNFGPTKDWTLDLDENNYFAQVNSANWDGVANVAVFITPEKKHILAVSSLGCGPLCHQSLVFLRREEMGWVDVTDEIFPALTEKEVEALAEQLGGGEFAGIYELPQEGTTITYYNQYDGIDNDPQDVTTLYEFRWEGGQFVRHKAF